MCRGPWGVVGVGVGFSICAIGMACINLFRGDSVLRSPSWLADVVLSCWGRENAGELLRVASMCVWASWVSYINSVVTRCPLLVSCGRWHQLLVFGCHWPLSDEGCRVPCHVGVCPVVDHCLAVAYIGCVLVRCVMHHRSCSPWLVSYCGDVLSSCAVVWSVTRLSRWLLSDSHCSVIVVLLYQRPAAHYCSLVNTKITSQVLNLVCGWRL